MLMIQHTIFQVPDIPPLRIPLVPLSEDFPSMHEHSVRGSPMFATHFLLIRLPDGAGGLSCFSKSLGYQTQRVA